MSFTDNDADLNKAAYEYCEKAFRMGNTEFYKQPEITRKLFLERAKYLIKNNQEMKEGEINPFTGTAFTTSEKTGE